MFKPTARTARYLLASSLALACSTPAVGNLELLKRSDDQYIQGLRDAGMSELLDRFVEVDPPEEPIARLTLEIALNDFKSSDLLARANDAYNSGQYDQGAALFQDSREAFEKVLGAQLKMIEDHPEDERAPLWQTDFANLVIFKFLPIYFRDVNWVYEFGLPSDEQKAAYEKWMVEALIKTSDAKFRLDMLPNRAGANPKLRAELEDQGIWYKLNDSRQLETSFMLANAAHGVSLLPSDHPYFKGKFVRNQGNNAEAERKRLREMAVAALSGKLSDEDRTKRQAQLLSGQTLVWSTDEQDIDEGIDDFLDKVIDNPDAPYQSYLASMAKAVGRWNVGSEQTALEMLAGMENNAYVKIDRTTSSRLLAADLTFRLLSEKAQKAPAAKRPELIAKAYETAYVPLIDLENDNRYRTLLFARWAQTAASVEDPASLPPAVRMGIGEQLMFDGKYKAEQLISAKLAGPPAVPSEKERWEKELATRKAEVDDILARSSMFNETLTGDDMEGPVLARGLNNLAWTRYYQGNLIQTFTPDETDWTIQLQAAQLWLAVAQRVPGAAQAKPALLASLQVIFFYEVYFNKERVTQQAARDVYSDTFLLLLQVAANEPVVNNNRVYAGFHLYEKLGDATKAIEIYRGLPRAHPEYYEARRQMIYAMLRMYRKKSDELQTLSAKKPPKAAPGAPAQLRAQRDAELSAWQLKFDKLDEDITRERDELIEEADIIIIDAKDDVEDGETTQRKFSAATALGAATVVLAGMESDGGNFDASLALLKGFEAKFDPKGAFLDLAPQEEKARKAAKAKLQALLLSAQEQRIITLLNKGDIAEMDKQAAAMMDAWPDVAAAMVNGVLNRIEKNIERERRVAQEALFDEAKRLARENVKFQAGAAVKLGDRLVKWAEGQNFEKEKMVAYRMPLAQSLMLSGESEDALAIMKKIEKEFPTNLRISILTGKAYLAVYKESNPKPVEGYNAARGQFAKVITYYNRQVEKPDYFWEAWLNQLKLMEAEGGVKKAAIPGRARILLNVDKNLGGPEFKEQFELIFENNGGVERIE